MTQEFRIAFITTHDLVERIKSDALVISGELRILSESPVKDATRLGMELGLVEEIVTIVTGTCYLGELAITMFRWLKNNNKKDDDDDPNQNDLKKIVVRGPFGTFELSKDSNLTEEEIRRFLKNIQKLI